MPPATAWSPHILDVQPAVLRWLRRAGHGEGSADVWHQAVQQVLSTETVPDPGRSPRSYLWAAARHEAGRSRVRGLLLGDAVFALPSTDDDPACLAAAAETRTRLGAAVQALPERYRSVVVGRFVEGRSANEVARRLDLPEGTVASRTHRALGLLRRRMAAARDGCGLLLALVLALTPGLRTSADSWGRARTRPAVSATHAATEAVAESRPAPRRGTKSPAPLPCLGPLPRLGYGDGYSWAHRPHPEI